MNHEITNNNIRVLVVDDSVMMSKRIAQILAEDDQIEVVGTALDGEEAVSLIPTLKPNVITLDIEMPRMNGITALKHIMLKYGIPTVMISALTQEGARTSFEALKYGAVEVIAKPSRRENESLESQKHDIVTKVKRAAAIRTGRSRYVRTVHPGAPVTRMKGLPADHSTRFIGVGAGTGAFSSLLKIIPHLPPDFADVLIVLVLTLSKYLEPFVAYLAEHSVIPVKHVRDSKVPERGTCYLASAEDGPVLTNRNAGKVIALQVTGNLAQSGNQGVIDGLFKSMSRIAGKNAVGVVMSGAGSDGAEGLQQIRRSGGTGIVQDSNNCIDPSMPLSVLEKGTVEKILADYEIAQYLMELRVKK